VTVAYDHGRVTVAYDRLKNLLDIAEGLFSDVSPNVVDLGEFLPARVGVGGDDSIRLGDGVYGRPWSTSPNRMR
jgi:hypothetical protein